MYLKPYAHISYLLFIAKATFLKRQRLPQDALDHTRTRIVQKYETKTHNRMLNLCCVHSALIASARIHNLFICATYSKFVCTYNWRRQAVQCNTSRMNADGMSTALQEFPGGKCDIVLIFAQSDLLANIMIRVWTYPSSRGLFLPTRFTIFYSASVFR
jgi:hypothetical protein